MPAEWEAQCGKLWGTGMGPIPLGGGGIKIAGVYEVFKDDPRDECNTLEVAGNDNMLKSNEYLKSLGAE